MTLPMRHLTPVVAFVIAPAGRTQRSASLRKTCVSDARCVRTVRARVEHVSAQSAIMPQQAVKFSPCIRIHTHILILEQILYRYLGQFLHDGRALVDEYALLRAVRKLCARG